MTAIATGSSAASDAPGTPVLRARGVTKTFTVSDPPVQVLRGIDLEVPAGEFLVVMGASGSGKSTLLYALSGLDRPTEGTIELDGTDLTALGEKEMSDIRLHRMGFIFQHGYFLDSLTIRDNVLLPAIKAAPKQVGQAAARVDALLERFGIAHVAGHGITEVSGGQLQRASICRALAAGPRVLFADEPTGALNSSMSQDVMEAVADVHSDGTTIVMVTHDPGVAARADRVVYLRDGLVVDQYRYETGVASDLAERERLLHGWLTGHGF